MNANAKKLYELSFVLKFGRRFLPGVIFCADGFGSPQLCFFPGPFKATKDGCKKQQTYMVTLNRGKISFLCSRDFLRLQEFGHSPDCWVAGQL